MTSSQSYTRLSLASSPTRTSPGSCPNRRDTQSRHAPWWTAEVKTACEAYHQARRLGPCTDERHSLRRAVRKAKRAGNQQRIEDASSLPEVYLILKWHKYQPQYSTPRLRRPDGTMEQSSTWKSTLLRETLLSRQLDAADLPTDTPVVSQREIPWEAITEAEVFNATCQLPSTTPGTDGVPAKFLRAAWPALGRRITQLFQNCVSQGIQPQVFKEAELMGLLSVLMTSPDGLESSLTESCCSESISSRPASSLE